MSWNHRVVKRTFVIAKDTAEEYSEDMYGVHEAYYDENGKVFMITETPIDPHGETLEELRQSLERMTKSLENPILDYDNIPEDGAIDPIPQ